MLSHRRIAIRSSSRRDPVAYEPRTVAEVASSMPMNPLHPKKLLLTKWTAVEPRNREKHFVVSRVAPPEEPGGAVPWVEFETVEIESSTRCPW